jgi:hypothetical protein
MEVRYPPWALHCLDRMLVHRQWERYHQTKTEEDPYQLQIDTDLPAREESQTHG